MTSKKDRIVLPAVRPSAAIEAAYQRRIDQLIREMHKDVSAHLRLDWRRNPPATVANDASSVEDIVSTLGMLSRKWLAKFDALAPSLASYFTQAVHDRSDRQLHNILKRGGFTVAFQMTDGQRSILHATVAENVSLIKSIPQQYLTEVEGMVMRSVVAGRDLGTLTQELQARYGITRRRAAGIARSQNNMATGRLQANRQSELGLSAMWLHSAGGKTPRPSHIKQSGKEYDPSKGWYDPDAKQTIWPGTLINCRCTSKTVVFPGRFVAKAA